VLEALALPMVHHRSTDFDPIFKTCLDNLQYVFRTKNPVVTLAGSGTAGMEAAVVSTLSPGDTVITLEAGKFGERWGKIAQAYGINVIPLKSEWGRSIEPAEVEIAVAKNSNVKAVFATLCETSTATLSDIQDIGNIVSKTEAILAVDAISGLAADRLETDEWGVDIAVGSSQKALMLPPGLAFATVSDKARKLMDTAKCPSFYLSLKRALKSLQENTTAFTPAVSLIVGLNEALSIIREEGIENVWARHRKLADAIRAGGQAIGLRLFSQAPSNTVVAFNIPQGVSYKDISNKLRGEFGLTIAGGQDHIKGKIFRMAAMGWADGKDVIQAVGSLEMVLRSLGHTEFEPGSGVGAAMMVMSGESLSQEFREKYNLIEI
jgi:aspartate aminotransferase-like enzyme